VTRDLWIVKYVLGFVRLIGKSTLTRARYNPIGEACIVNPC